MKHFFPESPNKQTLQNNADDFTGNEKFWAEGDPGKGSGDTVYFFIPNPKKNSFLKNWSKKKALRDPTKNVNT